MPNKTLIDSLYADPMTAIRRFRFDDKVAAVFPDMIKRSVPGYETILHMISDMAERYVQPGSHCYDLGCSLGAATLAIRRGIRIDDCRVIGIDNSSAMIQRCQQIVAEDPHPIPVELYCQDLETTTIERASMVVLNFTLQFVAPAQRQGILKKIFEGLLPGGIVLISEKIIFADSPHQQLMTELYHHFKRANGYSDLEIAQKRTALEQVLQPETLDTHKQRLRTTGFASVDIWFQCLNFASLIAIKSD